MEKLKALMTKLGIFKLMDKIDEKIKKGKDWVDDKKEKVKDKGKEMLGKIKGFLKGMFNKYTDESGETHTLKFKDTELYRESVSKTLGNYLNEVKDEINELTNADEKKKHLKSVQNSFTIHRKIVTLIGDTVKKTGDKYSGADKGFSPTEGETLRGYLQEIAAILRTLPIKNKKKIIPKTKISYKDGVDDGIQANATLISLDSDEAGSQPAGNNSPLSQKIVDIVLTKKDNHNLVRGHLINHELYGTGVGTKNLAPIPKRANSKMLNNFEKDAKNLMHSNNVISLKVVMNYGEPNDKKWSGKSLLKKNLPAGTKIPTSVTYDFKQLEFDKPSNSKTETINDEKNWKKSGLSKADEIPIFHDDFF
jgi:primosomal protein N''